MPTSDGTLNRAGVDPVQWAKDFLTRLNAPITSENMRAITAWEKAEGTAARFNPLATTQSGFNGETSFNSVGVKNYMSYADGLDANVKVINNGLYSNILAALQRGNDRAQRRAGDHELAVGHRRARRQDPVGAELTRPTRELLQHPATATSGRRVAARATRARTGVATRRVRSAGESRSVPTIPARTVAPAAGFRAAAWTAPTSSRCLPRW